MDALIVCSVVAGIGLFMGLAALVLAAEHQADIPALREEVDRLRSAVDRLSESVPEPHGAAEMAQEPAESPQEPFTRPIRIPVTPSGATAATRRTDTAEQGAVIEEQHRELVRREFGGVVFAFRAEGKG